MSKIQTFVMMFLSETLLQWILHPWIHGAPALDPLIPAVLGIRHFLQVLGEPYHHQPK